MRGREGPACDLLISSETAAAPALQGATGCGCSGLALLGLSVSMACAVSRTLSLEVSVLTGSCMVEPEAHSLRKLLLSLLALGRICFSREEACGAHMGA